jgi:hypothetical protein
MLAALSSLQGRQPSRLPDIFIISESHELYSMSWTPHMVTLCCGWHVLYSVHSFSALAPLDIHCRNPARGKAVLHSGIPVEVFRDPSTRPQTVPDNSAGMTRCPLSASVSS